MKVTDKLEKIDKLKILLVIYTEIDNEPLIKMVQRELNELLKEKEE